MREFLLSMISQQIMDHTSDFGVSVSAIDKLILYKIKDKSFIQTVAGATSISLIVKGLKQSIIGQNVYTYGKGQCLVSGFATPSTYHALNPSAKILFWRYLLTLIYKIF